MQKSYNREAFHTGVKIYVQNLKTQKFYAGGDQWTTSPRKALAFPNAVAALNFCQTLENASPNAQLMMRFGDPNGTLWLAVSEGRKTSPRRTREDSLPAFVAA